VAEPRAGASRGPRTDEARLTSLFRGTGEEERLPTMAAVEPSWEKATEPLEHETAGDRGDGLVFRLDELDIDERRFIHEARRVGTYLAVSTSDTLWSLGG
jgi:hypothetical protein